MKAGYRVQTLHKPRYKHSDGGSVSFLSDCPQKHYLGDGKCWSNMVGKCTNQCFGDNS